MLMTVPNNEVKPFGLLQQSGMKVWRMVSMEMNIPYYLMVHQKLENSKWLTTQGLFWRLEDVLQMAETIKADTKRKLNRVFLLAPDWMAKGLSWQMMEIKEIWLAEATGSDFSGCLHAYTTQCGIELTSLPFINENESLNKTKLLLSVPFAG